MIPALVGFGCLSPPPETVDIKENPLHNSLLFPEGEIIGDHGDEFAIGILLFGELVAISGAVWLL